MQLPQKIAVRSKLAGKDKLTRSFAWTMSLLELSLLHSSICPGTASGLEMVSAEAVANAEVLPLGCVYVGTNFASHLGDDSVDWAVCALIISATAPCLHKHNTSDEMSLVRDEQPGSRPGTQLAYHEIVAAALLLESSAIAVRTTCNCESGETELSHTFCILSGDNVYETKSTICRLETLSRSRS